jgi:hypothetical protein
MILQDISVSKWATGNPPHIGIIQPYNGIAKVNNLIFCKPFGIPELKIQNSIF